MAITALTCALVAFGASVTFLITKNFKFDALGLKPIHEWVGGFEQFWSESFDRLNEYVQELQQKENSGGIPS